MIYIAGEVDITPERAEEAKAAARRMMAETAKEAGCRHYRFYEDLETPGRFLVYEEWESEDALAAHFHTPHMAQWRDALAGIGVLRRELKKITGGAEAPL